MEKSLNMSLKKSYEYWVFFTGALLGLIAPESEKKWGDFYSDSAFLVRDRPCWSAATHFRTDWIEGALSIIRKRFDKVSMDLDKVVCPKALNIGYDYAARQRDP